MSCGASTEAKKLGVDYSYQGSSTFDVAEQTKIVNAVVATKPGAIMISITDPTAMIAPLTAAKNAGIKIIGIDGDLNDKSVMTTNIQSDGEKGGELAGDALAKAVGEKGTVLTIDNATGSVVSKARTDGFKTGDRQVPEHEGAADPVLGQRRLQGRLHRLDHGQHQLRPGRGLRRRDQQHPGRAHRRARVRQEGQVKVVGYDTSDPIVAALKDGSLTGTVVQYPRGEGSTGVAVGHRRDAGQDRSARPVGRRALRHPGNGEHGQGPAVHLRRQLQAG